MEQARVTETAECFEFVPASPPYVAGTIRKADGKLLREFRYYDLKIMVKALHGPNGAALALEAWLDHLAATGKSGADNVTTLHAATRIA